LCRYDVQRRCAYEKHSGHRESHSGIGRKPFAFPPESPFTFSPESLFAFTPESFSRSPRNPFHLRPESAKKYPDLLAHWSAAEEVWTFHDSPPFERQEPADSESERLFKDIAGSAVRLIGKVGNGEPPWHVWLDLMRKGKQGFLRLPAQARTFRQFQIAMESGAEAAHLPLTNNGSIANVFERSAEFCDQLDHQAATSSTGAEHGNEDRGGLRFAALAIIDRNGVTGPIDEHLFAGLVILPEHHIPVSVPPLIEFAEPAVTVAIGMNELPDTPPTGAAASHACGSASGRAVGRSRYLAGTDWDSRVGARETEGGFTVWKMKAGSPTAIYADSLERAVTECLK
jgi:hypothetical protein